MTGTTPVVGPWRAVGPDRLELGEGARYVGDGFVAVDLLQGRLLRIDDDRVAQVTVLDVPLGAVAARTDGGWIAAAGTGVALVGLGGEVTWVSQPEQDAPTAMRMNDAVADPHGRFWAGSMAYDGTSGAGSLYRVDPDLTVVRVLEDLTIPNGPAFDAAGSTMYLADSARGTIYRHRVDVETGALSDGAVFATVDDASPDGMTVDAEGCLWSALWGGSRLHRYAPDGRLVDTVEVPASQPTSVALSCGPDPEILVTTASLGLSPRRNDGHLLRSAARVPGLPVARFGPRRAGAPGSPGGGAP
jgi:sugar lactone lactonase YvrE